MKNFAFALFICVLATLAALGVPPVSGQGVERRLQPSVDLIDSTTTEACTAADTDLTTLWTYTLPGGTINTDGRGFRVTVFGVFGNNTNTKNLFVVFGNDTIYARSNATTGGLAWSITATVLRVSNTSYVGQGVGVLAGTGFAFPPVTPAETFSEDTAIIMRAQNGSANANDVCFDGGFIELLQ